MILLPTLLRTVTGGEDLPYQVAPGLSEVPKDFLPKLDLEAAKVAYLVDSDGGGDALVALLAEGGVPAKLIVRLGFPGVENLLDAVTYVEAVSSLLSECNPEAAPEQIPALPTLPDAIDESWAPLVAEWARDNGLQMPSKVAVANWLVERGKAEPSAAARMRLQELHFELTTALTIS